MPQLSKKQWEKLLDRLDQGETKAALSREYGVSASAIRSHEKKRQAQAEVALEEIRRQREQAEAARQAGGAPIRTPDGHETTSDAGTMSEYITTDPATGTVTTTGIQSPTAIPQSVEDELAFLRSQVADLSAEVAQFRPTPHQWGWDPETIHANLQDQLDDMVAQDLVNMNRRRLENGLAPLRPAEIEESQPGWYQRTVDRIIDDALAALSESAYDEGPDKIKRVLLDPKGNGGTGSLQQIVLGDGMDNGPQARIQKLLNRGWKDITPQPCARYNCWLPPDPKFTVGNLNFCGQLHHHLYVSFLGTYVKGVTTSGAFEI